VTEVKYRVLADARLEIKALRVNEDYEPISIDRSKLGSAVVWLGEGSEIILKKTPINEEKWLKYLKRKMGAK